MLKNTIPRLVWIAAVLVGGMGCADNEIAPNDTGVFIKFFGNPYLDQALVVAEDRAQGFLIGGQSDVIGNNQPSAYLLKADANGNLLWEYSPTANTPSSFADLATNAQNEPIAFGSEVDSRGLRHFAMSRFPAAGGNPLVSVVFPAPVVTNLAGDTLETEEIGARIRVLADGNFLLAGAIQARPRGSTGAFGQPDMLVQKVTPDGAVLWQRIYGIRDRLDLIGNLAELPNGDLLFCGTLRRFADADLRVFRTDAFGNIRWDFQFDQGEQNQTGKDMAALPDGSFVLLGENQNDLLLLKINADGVEDAAFTTAFQAAVAAGATRNGTSLRQTASALKVVGAEGVIVAGTQEKTADDTDAFLLKINADGSAAWPVPVLFGSPRKDTGNHVALAADGGFYLLGTSEFGNKPGVNVITFIKTNAEGKAF